MDQTPPDGTSAEELRAHIDRLREETRRLMRVEEELAAAEERLRQRDEQLTALRDAAYELRNAPDIHTLVRVVSHHAMRSFPADVALVLMEPGPYEADASGTIILTQAAGEDPVAAKALEGTVSDVLAAMSRESVSAPEMLFAGQEHASAAIRELLGHATTAHGAPADTDVARTLVLPFFKNDGTPRGLLLALAFASSDKDAAFATARDLPLFAAFAAHVEETLDARGDTRAARDASMLASDREGEMQQRIEALERELKARDRIQAQLIAARDGAEERARSKANFLASMSHEIRTPLNGIVGTVELLRAESMSRPQRQRLEVLRSCVSSLQTLVGDILDFSRIEAGYLSLDLRPFPVGDVIEGTYQSLLFQRHSPRVGFEVVIGDNVPDVVIGDPDRLGQILNNLCDNALKFTTQGQVTLRVRVSERTPANYADEVTLRFEIEDTGIGMAPDQLERVFQPFRQAEPTTSHTYGGTGLGLAICKQLVEAMGGAIGVTSTLGIGSRFWFTITLEVASESDLEESSREHPLPESTHAAPRILLVDDNLINQKVAASLLERLGCQTQVANNGIEAVATARTRPFDLIFMDCQMPHMDGYQAATEIRRIPSHATTPIIALTAYASQDDRVRCLECGMNDYVAKPVTAKRLRDVLNRWTSEDATPPA